jgi:hypothetical protein
MNGEAPKKKKTWIWVVLGVVVFLGFVAIGGIVVAVSFFRQNASFSENVSEDSAKSEFDAVYAKFPGQQPLIQMRDGRPQLVPERATKAGNGQLLSTLHVIAFDPDDDELAKISLPFWLLRMKSGPIRINEYSDGWDDRGVSFEIKDIENAGPGIVVDVNSDDVDPGRRRRDGRLLIWVE